MTTIADAMGGTMKRAFMVASTLLWSGTCLAENTINKADILKATRDDCPAQFLKNKQFIDMLLMGGGTLPAFCECLAVRIASQLDDADYGDQKAIARKWSDSQNFCLAISIASKKQS